MTLTALPGLPEIQTGDDLAGLLIASVQSAGTVLQNGDVVALAQKIVSKAEGRLIALADVTPGAHALELAAVCGKPAALVELALGESVEVVRCAPGVIILRHRLGFVLANAGIDQSNVAGAETHALLLPLDPDASAARVRRVLADRAGADVAVLINDSFGRAWRQGVCGTCIGASGLATLIDARGRHDRFGRAMQMTEIAAGDELAAAASLMMGQVDEGTPAVLIRGLPVRFLGAQAATALVRPVRQDLFR